MTVHDLIFSNKRRIRVGRHVTFWFCWYLYMAGTQLRNQTPEVIGMKNFIIYQLAVSLNRVLLQICFCYLVVYLIIPYFFKRKKYWQFSAFFILAAIGEYWLTFFDFTYVWHNTYVWMSKSLPYFYDPNAVRPLSPFLNRYYIVYSNVHFTGTLVSCGIILVVKYYKSWYQKQRENEMLMKENSQAELQLLKAQVHPHFLFNTLNNIYALTLDKSPVASATVTKLSDMVKYMVNEGAETFVPVSKEIKMLLDYIGLEKIRYGDRLDLNVRIQQNGTEDILVAPMLMIPFVENCFKHGASKMVDNAQIDLWIETDNESLLFRISNSVPVAPRKQDDRKSIGLVNVQKRLALIYPEEHRLNIRSSENRFEVNMELTLSNRKARFATA